MSILDEIILHKQQELEKLEDFDTLDQRIKDHVASETLPACRGFYNTLVDVEGPALIAELKKASPSKGVIKENFDVYQIARAYQEGGAHCFSVLTDSKYFQGSYENLISVSTEFDLPCLCKEFIIDPKQIAEARLAGADAILLIAAVLSDEELVDFREIAYDYGMDVLIEVHNSEEMQRALEMDFEMIGINNRDLNTFEVSLDTTSKLLSKFKYDLAARLIVSESGINTRADVLILYNMGVKAFLVGESLIKQDDIRQAVFDLIG
jgi:indole-3-glycerol phosphate synthase